MNSNNHKVNYELRELHESLYFELWGLNFELYDMNYELREWHELFSNKDLRN